MNAMVLSASLRIALASALWVSGLGSGWAKVVELNLGHVVTEQNAYHVAATRLAEIAARMSNGEIKITVFPGGALGGEPKQIQAIRTGTQDMAIMSGAPLEATAQEFSAFSFPYLFKDLDEANRVLQGPVGREMLDLLPKYNIIGFDFISPVERSVMTRSKVISGARDMEGMKIRVIPGPGFIASYGALGAQPTPIAYSELYMALQTGMVDAAENSPDTIMQERFNEVIKTFSLSKMMYMPALIIISKRKYDALSPEHRKILRAASAQAAQEAIVAYRQAYDAALTELAKTVDVSTPDMASFLATAPSVYARLRKEFPAASPWVDKLIEARNR